MILKIDLHVLSPTLLNFNYQDKLNGFFYKCIEKHNPEKFDLYHNNKLRINKRPFKPFVFSEIYFEEKIPFKNKGYLIDGKGTIYFASSDEDIINSIKAEIYKGIMIHNIILNVHKVKEINISDVALFQTLSPVCITNKKDEKRYMMHPNEDDYIMKLKNNIIKKHIFRTNEQISYDDFDIQIRKILQEDGSLIMYKDKQIKGYKYVFQINASLNVKETIATLGIGNFNSCGFGFSLPYKGVFI